VRDERCISRDVIQVAHCQRLSFEDDLDERIMGVVGRSLMRRLCSGKLDAGCPSESTYPRYAQRRLARYASMRCRRVFRVFGALFARSPICLDARFLECKVVSTPEIDEGDRNPTLHPRE